MAKAAFHTALNLLFFATVGTALLALTYNLTRDTIARSEENEKLKLVRQIVPVSAYDNDIMKDIVTLGPDNGLGSDHDTIAYRGRLKNAPSIAVFQATAPEGYAGNISFIIAIHYDGRIGGVRVVSHHETPGLGDYIEIAKNDWINGFNDLSLENRHDNGWKVKKDGGNFDYMAGATVTPRAMIKAVHNALQYFQIHRDEIFSQSVPLRSLTKEKNR
ncbi:MAG: electron transport complex subunit RsxG [Gallionella sp.]